MKVSYINEGLALMWPEAMEDNTPYDIKRIVADMLAVRTTKDVIDFILDTPASFFKDIVYVASPTPILENDLIRYEPDHAFRGSVLDLIERNYSDIEILDMLVVKSGELGTYVEKFLLAEPRDDEPVYANVLYPPKRFCEIHFSTIETLILNVQTVLRMAAIANGEQPLDGLERIPLKCNVPAVAIDTGLSISSDMNRIPAQHPSYKTYFTEKEAEALKAELTEMGIRELCRIYHGKGRGSIFLYPEGLSDQEMAANIFTSFMNSLFEKGSQLMFVGNTFKVERMSKGFRVIDCPWPLRDMYRQAANLAADNSVKLCPYCGKPLLSDKSRGNEAMYCSRTCNTKASAQRRETAYALAASGVPLEEAIARIGNRYEQSIRRWYHEAKELLH